MKRALLLSAFLWVLLLAVAQIAWSGTPGTFRGILVSEPEAAGAKSADWLYVEGRNHMVRRVALGQAQIIYADEVPAAEREKDPARSLIPGTEVRVTAEQDGDGEWRAQRIEILATAAEGRSKAPARSST